MIPKQERTSVFEKTLMINRFILNNLSDLIKEETQKSILAEIAETQKIIEEEKNGREEETEDD